MSAARLREAARQMRINAEAATTGPWEAWSGSEAGGGEYISAADGYTLGIDPGLSGDVGWARARLDAEHIASWHPVIALAVADLLDAMSEAHIHIPGSDSEKLVYDMPGMENSPAMKVADAYLGGAA